MIKKPDFYMYTLKIESTMEPMIITYRITQDTFDDCHETRDDYYDLSDYPWLKERLEFARDEINTILAISEEKGERK